MNIKRAPSFAIIALAYALATVVGVLIYQALDFTAWLSLLIADIVATLVVFAFSVIFKNASVYDPYWSVQPIIILTCFAIGYGLNLTSALVVIVIALWGVRLTANWAYTFKGMAHQDWRYTMLKERTGTLYPLVNLLGIHLVPTLVVYLCTLPAMHVIIARPVLEPEGLVALLLSIVAIALQTIADIQMHIYRKNRKTAFVRIGVWKNARHPNYLGEILMWWGVALYCIAQRPDMWYMLAGALANSLLFAFVSIPMAEERQAKKEGFEEYKGETNLLFPFKRIVEKELIEEANEEE